MVALASSFVVIGLSSVVFAFRLMLAFEAVVRSLMFVLLEMEAFLGVVLTVALVDLEQEFAFAAAYFVEFALVLAMLMAGGGAVEIDGVELADLDLNFVLLEIALAELEPVKLAIGLDVLRQCLSKNETM